MGRDFAAVRDPSLAGSIRSVSGGEAEDSFKGFAENAPVVYVTPLRRFLSPRVQKNSFGFLIVVILTGVKVAFKGLNFQGDNEEPWGWVGGRGGVVDCGTLCGHKW